MANATSPGWWPDWAPDVNLMPLVWTLIVLALAWIVIRLGERGITRSARRRARRRKVDLQMERALVGRTRPMRMALKISVVLFSTIAILGVWGLTTAFTGLLAGAGFLGLVIGIAAADMIGDIVAGFMIFFDHPFDIGDWVEVAGMQGIVEDVALGATIILTFDNEKITIPNKMVETSPVKNFSHARKLRARIVVGVEYGSHLGTAMQTLVELAKAHEWVFKEPAPQAVSIGFGASSVDLELRFWVEPVRNSVIAVKTDLIHAIHDRFRADGIPIAFPHMQLVQGEPLRIEQA